MYFQGGRNGIVKVSFFSGKVVIHVYTLILFNSKL